MIVGTIPAHLRHILSIVCGIAILHYTFGLSGLFRILINMGLGVIVLHVTLMIIAHNVGFLVSGICIGMVILQYVENPFYQKSRSELHFISFVQRIPWSRFQEVASNSRQFTHHYHEANLVGFRCRFEKNYYQKWINEKRHKTKCFGVAGLSVESSKLYNGSLGIVQRLFSGIRAKSC